MKYALVFLLGLFSIGLYGAPLKVNIASDYIPSPNSNADMVTRLLIDISKRLYPQLEIDFMPASRIREWRTLSMYPNTCLYNKVKNPEREALAYFSVRPLTAFPSNRLVLRDKKGFSADVALSDLVKTDFKIAITKGRSYGKNIDDFIKSHPQLFVVSEGEESAKRLRKMLMQGRFDGMIEYTSVIISEYAEVLGENKISFHRIIDQAPSVFGYIACAKTPQGKQAINLFNKKMAESEVQELIIEAHRDLFSPYERDFISDSLKIAFSIQP